MQLRRTHGDLNSQQVTVCCCLLLVLVLAPSVFLRVVRFSQLHKNQHSNSNSIWKQWTKSLSVAYATANSYLFLFLFYFFKLTPPGKVEFQIFHISNKNGRFISVQNTVTQSLAHCA